MRVATVPLQQSLSLAIERSQKQLADTQMQLNTGKKAAYLSGLGADTVRSLSTRSLMEQQKAQSKAANQLGITLSLYDSNITTIDNTTSTLRTALLTALGNDQAAALKGSIDAAFDSTRSALNASDGSGPLFAGGQSIDQPFVPTSVEDTLGKTPDQVFANDDVRASARVGDNVDITYGITAKDLGSGLLTVYQTLAGMGTIGDTLTADQKAIVKTAIGQIDAALPGVRSFNAANGIRQQQVEALGQRAEDRTAVLTQSLSDLEDADYGQLKLSLDQQQTIYKASLSVFAQLNSLSLADYLK